MRKLKWIIFLVLVFAVGPAFAQTHPTEGYDPGIAPAMEVNPAEVHVEGAGGNPTGSAPTQAEIKPATQLCPVCFKEFDLNEGHKVQYKDKIYTTCSIECQTTFKRHPPRVLKNLEKMKRNQSKKEYHLERQEVRDKIEKDKKEAPKKKKSALDW